MERISRSHQRKDWVEIPRGNVTLQENLNYSKEVHGGNTMITTHLFIKKRRTFSRMLIITTILSILAFGQMSFANSEPAKSMFDDYILVSKSPDRSNARPLTGAHLTGNVYIFVPTEGIVSATYYGADGKYISGKGTAPFDFNYTKKDGTARPFDTSQFKQGWNGLGVSVKDAKTGKFKRYASLFGVGGQTTPPTTPTVPPTTPTVPPTTPTTPPNPTRPYPKVVSVAWGSIQPGEQWADGCIRLMAEAGFTGCVFYQGSKQELTSWSTQLQRLASKVGNKPIDLQLTSKYHSDAGLEDVLKNLPPAWKEGFIYNIWQEPEDNAFKDRTPAEIDAWTTKYRNDYTAAAKITRKYGVSLPWLEFMDWTLDPYMKTSNPHWDHNKLIPPAGDFGGVLWSVFEFNQDGGHHDKLDQRIAQIKTFMNSKAPGKPWGLMAGGYSVKQTPTVSDYSYRKAADWYYRYYQLTKENGSVSFGWFDASSQYDPANGKNQDGENLILKNPYIRKPIG